MPDRYHIHVVPTPGRFRREGKFGNVDWREDCSRCTNCVKLRCIYEVYKKENAHNRDAHAPVELLNECKACMSCVQGCTKGLLSVSLNPEFLALGDEYWRPDILATLWNQSETGKVPVSGAGYRGRFHGPGFDSIWTDMSEIVRPTRDGIHGREYISTSVDIGAKPMRLAFGPDGAMIGPRASLIELQLPAILDVPPWPLRTGGTTAARLAAAAALKTLAVVPAAEAASVAGEHAACLVPLIAAEADIALCQAVLPQCRMVEIADGKELLSLAQRVQSARTGAPGQAVVIAARIDLTPQSADRVVELARAGIKVLHLCADLHGREKGPNARHIKDVLREIHGRLVSEGMRDEVTLIVGGGIALAEHMAKAIICGADLVAVSTALLVSLGCRVCRGAHGEAPSDRCPAEFDNVEPSYTTQQFINLMGAWHNQLVEVLGAMGIREVRRLRGEVGRAIFMEDIEKEAFGDLVRK